ncbi:MAG: hypothetical protein A3G18_03370 [Rhodospirillales bacterium RIFCSPLOWO2_12_FULL_58_28]|nr:MAG: hypothetical protein A3H92_03315 [Rhodospirillales bacterium RIFCSPLOWO2_02_FULL_58_16]OHC77317.1 MAG: hypothetical protein A3G18_03370 [Rhodospirillales bacterium RIFCSPLOWO2_12_FULL_58_28]
MTALRTSISLGIAVVFHAGIAFALYQQTLPSTSTSIEAGNFEVVDLPAPTPVPAPKAEPEPETARQSEPVKAEVAELKAPIRKPHPPVKDTLPKEETSTPKPEPTPAASSTTVAQKDESLSYVPPDNRAAYLQNPHPLYPAQARRKGLQGAVLLTVEVSAEGLPLSLTVKESSGVNLLDDAAVESVRRWKFVAATRGGKPVAAFVEIPIRFVLQNS